MNAQIARPPHARAQPADGEDGGVRFNRTFSFIASLLLVTPSVAFAQDYERNVGVAERARPEYDPLGTRLGGFRLNAAVEVGAEYSDNLFADTSGNERDDIFFIVRPEAQLTSTWSRHAAYVNVGGALRQYDEYSSENANSWFLGAGGRMDITRDTIAGVDAYIAREVESRNDPGAVATVDYVDYDVRRYSGYFAHSFSRVTLRASAGQTTYDYHNAGFGFDQNLRDRTDTTFGLRGLYEVTPRLSVLGEVISEDREYDIANATPNSDGVTYLVGAAFDISNLLRGEVSVGQFEREYTPTLMAPNVGKVSGTAVSGRVQWFATPLTTVTVGATRDVQESGYDRPYVYTSFSARADHELLRNLILSAGVSDATLEFEGLDREDSVRLYDVGARYLMNRRVSFSAAFIRNETESDGTGAYRDFDENRFRFGVRVAL